MLWITLLGGVTDRYHIADCIKFIHSEEASALSVCDLGSTETLHLRATNLRVPLVKWRIARYNVCNTKKKNFCAEKN